MSAWRIARYLCNMYPYKISVNQALTTHDIERRANFATIMQGSIENNLIRADQIIFTDEAHFWMGGYVNSQNYRHWGTSNPHYTVSKELHPAKVTVWAALSSVGIKFHFIETTVNSQVYQEMLETIFFPWVINQGLNKDYWFMQNGATPHRKKDVFRTIHRVFGERVIALGYREVTGGGIEWPPYSPDLTPCDFFLWGYLKDRVYAQGPQSIDDLKNIIVAEIQAIEIDMILKVFRNFEKRIQYVLECNGGHFENIYI